MTPWFDYSANVGKDDNTNDNPDWRKQLIEKAEARSQKREDDGLKDPEWAKRIREKALAKQKKRDGGYGTEAKFAQGVKSDHLAEIEGEEATTDAVEYTPNEYEKELQMRRFEYDLERFSLVEKWNPQKQAEKMRELISDLDQKGSEGWELLGLHDFQLVGGITGKDKGLITLTVWKRETSLNSSTSELKPATFAAPSTT